MIKKFRQGLVLAGILYYNLKNRTRESNECSAYIVARADVGIRPYDIRKIGEDTL